MFINNRTAVYSFGKFKMSFNMFKSFQPFLASSIPMPAECAAAMAAAALYTLKSP
jgi:hypothetical protein